MSYQDIQRQTYYAERIGKVYGCFEVVKVELDPNTRKQLWTMKCIHCGAIRTTENGRDYVKGRNPGVCRCKRQYTRNLKTAQKTKKPIKEKPAPITHHELYCRWASMKARCYREKDKDFPNYGGRGITVCDEWRNDFWAFAAWAYASGYKPGLTIDRIDNDLGYSPDNCRWVERADQNRNKRNIPLYDGQTIPQICEASDVSYHAVKSRMAEGMSIDDAISDTAETKKRRAMWDKCRAAGMSPTTVKGRMDRGMSFDNALALGHRSAKTQIAEINGVTKTVRDWCDEYGVCVQTVKYRMRTKGISFEEALTASRDVRGRRKKKN